MSPLRSETTKIENMEFRHSGILALRLEALAQGYLSGIRPRLIAKCCVSRQRAMPKHTQVKTIANRNWVTETVYYEWSSIGQSGKLIPFGKIDGC